MLQCSVLQNFITEDSTCLANPIFPTCDQDFWYQIVKAHTSYVQAGNAHNSEKRIFLINHLVAKHKPIYNYLRIKPDSYEIIYSVIIEQSVNIYMAWYRNINVLRISGA